MVESLRRHVGWEVDEHAAKVTFTELLANVLRHGKSPLSVWLQCEHGAVKLHVLESGNGFKCEPHLSNPTSESGRGLYLVSKMTSELKIEGNPRGTHIIATLPRKNSPARQ
jgi:signal transduction histidine kinase